MEKNVAEVRSGDGDFVSKKAAPIVFRNKKPMRKPVGGAQFTA